MQKPNISLCQFSLRGERRVAFIHWKAGMQPLYVGQLMWPDKVTRKPHTWRYYLKYTVFDHPNTNFQDLQNVVFIRPDTGIVWQRPWTRPPLDEDTMRLFFMWTNAASTGKLNPSSEPCARCGEMGSDEKGEAETCAFCLSTYHVPCAKAVLASRNKIKTPQTGVTSASASPIEKSVSVSAASSSAPVSRSFPPSSASSTSSSSVVAKADGGTAQDSRCLRILNSQLGFLKIFNSQFRIQAA